MKVTSAEDSHDWNWRVHDIHIDLAKFERFAKFAVERVENASSSYT